MSSSRPPARYQGYRDILIDLAWRAIRYGLDRGRPPAIELQDYPAPLRDDGASFVTLKAHGQLRGCIGSLEPHRPLVQDVARNAFAAAFSDPRFPPLSAREMDGLQLHISILHPAEPMTFQSEDDLVRQLRPGVDGLILEADGRRGTFLPAVWESLPDPREFLANLKLKAGQSPDYWSDTVRIWRYTTESIE